MHPYRASDAVENQRFAGNFRAETPLANEMPLLFRSGLN